VPLSALPVAAILAGEGPRDRGSGRGSNRADGAGVLVAGRMLRPNVRAFPSQTRGSSGGSTLSAVSAGRERDRVRSTVDSIRRRNTPESLVIELRVLHPPVESKGRKPPVNVPTGPAAGLVVYRPTLGE
jgi:hypothetical protein